MHLAIKGSLFLSTTIFFSVDVDCIRIYNMNDYEKELTLNGDYKVYQDGYLVSTNYKKYYSMSGEEFYKR